MRSLIDWFTSSQSLAGWVLAFLVLAPMASPSSAGSPGAVGARAPDFALKNVVTQDTVRLAELRGQVVLMYVWFEVCPLCLDEAKEFDHAMRPYGTRGAQSLIIIEHGNELEIDMESEIYQPASAMINDPEGRFGRLYRIKEYPIFLVVDGRGWVRYRGSLLRGRDLTSLIDRLLSESGRKN